jgi:hypothetical protein
MTKLPPIANIIMAVLIGVAVFLAVGRTAALPTARADELAWFWLSVGNVVVCGRLVWLTWCRFRLRERAGYNGVARRLTLGYLRLYGILGLVALTASTVGFMTLLQPSGGVPPANAFEAWAVAAGRAYNVPALLTMMVWLTLLIWGSAIEEERLRIYFERNDKETHP